MKRIFAGIVATASLFAFAAPALAHTAYPVGAVNIRSGPGTTFSVIGTLSDGEKAAILSHDGTWLKVKTAGGLVGYMADWVTREVFDDEALYVQIDTDVLNVRQDPSTDGAILGRVYQGQQYHVLEGLGGWYRIEAGNIGTGWVNSQYVFKVAQPPASQPPVKTPPLDRPPGDRTQLGLSKAVSAATNAIIWNGRSTDYDQVASVRAGQMLTYLDSAEGWLYVANADGDKGWVNGQNVYVWDKGIDFSDQATYGVSENNWMMSFLPVRQVIDSGEGLSLRTGPSKDAAVKRSLHAGDRLKLLYVPSTEFVQVMVSDGTVGWVSRYWLKPVAAIPSETVRLTQPQPGVQRLEITGLSGGGKVTVANNTLSVSLAANPNRKAGLAIGEHSIVSLLMDASSLQMRMQQAFTYQVTEQSDSRLVIEVRPTVSAIDQIPGTDRTTYRFTTTGSVEPEAHREGNAVLLSLPGARLQSGITAPGILTLNATPSGLQGRVVTDRPFAIKRGAGYIDLVFYASGLNGKTIVLDAGHGGSETGAIGAAGVVEKNVNLAIALKLQRLLQAAGAKVIMTRSGDVRCASPDELKLVPSEDQLRYDLNCRSTTANTAGADVFLSVHSNANPSTAERGTEVYWALDNLNAAQSKVLATAFQTQLVSALGTRDRGVKDDVFYVIKYTEAPAALAEVGFLTNSTEEQLLKQDSFQQKAAEALFNGLQQYFQ